MTLVSTLADCWLGLCRKAPVLHTASAVVLGDPGETRSIQPDAGGAAGGQGRIRNGITIATGSIRTLARDKRLLWFSLLAGIVILFLIMAEGWNVTHYHSLLPSSIWIPFGVSSLIVFDLRLFLIEAICLSGFIFLLAGLVLYRNGSSRKKDLTIHEGLNGVNIHAGTLVALSVVMAIIATTLFEITGQSQLFGTIESGISMAMFYLPYAYYFPTTGLFSALFFSFRIMVINVVLFLLALYVVPVIVLENKGLLPAVAGSVGLMKKTWRELVGCMLVFGAIVLVVTAIGLLIGQSPLLLNHDYDFFLQMSRGQILMTVVCYGFLLACGVLMALGTTVLGVAVTNLYTCGRTGSLPAKQETSSSPLAESSR